MIVDKIENYPLYIGLGDRMRLAFEHIRTTDFTQSKTGRYDLDGDNLFVIVNDYKTVSQQAGQLEGHRHYIDVQYLVRGTEWIGYAPLAGQKMAMDYDEADDCLLYEGEATFFKVQAGMFAVFFPQDLHQPGTGQEPNPVRKVVVKVKIS